jgi:hypothetical protein
LSLGLLAIEWEGGGSAAEEGGTTAMCDGRGDPTGAAFKATGDQLYRDQRSVKEE